MRATGSIGHTGPTGPTGPTGLAIAACIVVPAPAPCLAADPDQQRVAEAFVAAAIRLAPLAGRPFSDRPPVAGLPYRGRHRRSIAACPGDRLQAVRP